MSKVQNFIPPKKSLVTPSLILSFICKLANQVPKSPNPLNRNPILLVWSSVNFFYLARWCLRSPPCIKSIIKYRFSLSWNAYDIFTMNLKMGAHVRSKQWLGVWSFKKLSLFTYGCFRTLRSWRSFITETTLFLVITLKLIKTLEESNSNWVIFT